MASFQYEHKMRSVGTDLKFQPGIFQYLAQSLDEKQHIGTCHDNQLDAGSDTGTGKHAEKKTVPSQDRLWSTTPVYNHQRKRKGGQPRSKWRYSILQTYQNKWPITGTEPKQCQRGMRVQEDT